MIFDVVAPGGDGHVVADERLGDNDGDVANGTGLVNIESIGLDRLYGRSHRSNGHQPCPRLAGTCLLVVLEIVCRPNIFIIHKMQKYKKRNKATNTADYFAVTVRTEIIDLDTYKKHKNTSRTHIHTKLEIALKIKCTFLSYTFICLNI